MIVLATNNKGKVKEIKEILKSEEIKTLKEMNINIEIEEDGESFEENALKKAREIHKLTKTASIADDSGICIEMLNDFPGVRTARFLGEEATQEERNMYLINKLKGAEKENRKVKFITCIAYVDEKGNEKLYKGILNGYIAEKPRGSNGFGFDEIFELEDGRTLAELEENEKNNISSRKIALENLRKDIG
jgi:non-canonical purine NTP pyrophosphatase, rdgB/HAM1 family